MRFRRFVLLVILSLTVGSARPSMAPGQSWSPDGRWLAYVLTRQPVAESEPWLLGASRSPQLVEAASGTRQLWATEMERDGRPGASVLLAESEGPLTRPTWSRDGSVIAFGRFVLEEGEPRGFELVVKNSTDGERIVRSWSLPPGQRPTDDLDQAELSWSPDGVHLAVSRPDQPGLLVIRAEDGRTIHDLPDARRPAWSPDSDRLALSLGGDEPGLYLLELRNGEVRRLAEGLGQDRLPAAVWSSDGRHLYRLAYDPQARRRLGSRRGVAADLPERAQGQVRLERLALAGGAPESLQSLPASPIDEPGSLEAVSLAIDREGEDAFVVVNRPDEPTAITWFRLRNSETRARLFLARTPLLLGSLALAPSQGRRDETPILALRVGDSGSSGSLALLEPAEDRFRAVAPDEGSRLAWVERLLLVIGDSLAEPDARPWVETRPTLLPLPGPDGGETAATGLPRLARLGRPLCDPSSDPAASSAFDEARFVFDYLTGDYGPCLTSMDALSRRVSTPDGRRRLLGLRAQVFMALRRLDRAEGVLAYLRESAVEPHRRIEEGPGDTLQLDEPAGTDWVVALSTQLERLRVPTEEVEPDHVPPFGNPDAPQPGLGLDPLPEPAPRFFPVIPRNAPAR